MSPRLLTTVILVAVAACGPSVHGDDDDVTTDARIDAPADGPSSDGDELPSRVYAHSGQMLYRIDTTTLAAVPVGPFTNLGSQSMTDIAVDRDEKMVGVTLDGIWTINVTTGVATHLADFTGTANLTSLSFVPVNTADPDGPEMLIAATDTGDVVRVDVSGTTATTTVLGNYGTNQGTQIVSSGDIVYVKGYGTVATVNVGTGAALTNHDHLATIDPANGWHATIIGNGTSYDKIFGLAFWGGKIYGFVDTGTSSGAFVQLDRQTGASTLLQNGSIRWYGAGVTTVAPLID